MNNRKRLKKLILANKETRCLYRMMQFLAIFMVVSCLVIIALAKWIEYNQNKKREELFGSWDEVFLNVDQDDLNYFRKNAFLEQISVQSIQEKVFLEGDQRVVIGSCDENFLEMGNIELLEGRMPKHEKEVVIEEEYLEVLGVSSIEDIVPDNSRVESLRGYRIVGVIENYSRQWKSVNPDVKYLNCIIKCSQPIMNLVFVKYNNCLNNDIEINMLDYRTNINKVKVNYKMFTLILMCSIILLIILMRNIIYTLSIKYTGLQKEGILRDKLLVLLIMLNFLFFTIRCGISSVIIMIALLATALLYKRIIRLILSELLLSLSVLNFLDTLLLNHVEKIFFLKLPIPSFSVNSYNLMDSFKLMKIITENQINHILLSLNEVMTQNLYNVSLLILGCSIIFITLTKTYNKLLAERNMGEVFNQFYFYDNKKIIFMRIKEIAIIPVIIIIVDALYVYFIYGDDLMVLQYMKILLISLFVCMFLNFMVMILIKIFFSRKAE